MALTMTEVIAQADILVPNGNSTADKMLWLNEVNNKFFSVVKIPLIATFTTAIGVDSPSAFVAGVQANSINKVQIGNSIYKSYLHEDVRPNNNYFTFVDSTRVMTIVPTPTAVLPGIVRYFRTATTTYVDSAPSLALGPDAPSEYHFVYIFGLAQKIAEAQEDVSKANNYGSSFNGNLLIAQQNYSIA